ncbi:MAG TPA: FAD binding domain-containing protein [Thermodesulfobacteriota bacterium]
MSLAGLTTRVLARFEYAAPTSLEAALDLLGRHGEAARPLAGGTDLLLQMRRGRMRPAVLVDLKRVPGLAGIENGGGLRIGALASHADLVASPLAAAPARRALAEAARCVSGPQIRNRGTVGGNLCNASPAADLAPPLLALGAAVEVARRGAPVRTLPAERLFAGPGRTVLSPGDLLVGIALPAAAARTGSAYERATRVAIDIALVGVAACVTLAADGTVAEARVALGAVAPTPILAAGAAAALVGRAPEPAALAAAARAAAADARPITAVRASADYRRHMVEVLARRALARAVAAARSPR